MCVFTSCPIWQMSSSPVPWCITAAVFTPQETVEMWGTREFRLLTLPPWASEAAALMYSESVRVSQSRFILYMRLLVLGPHTGLQWWLQSDVWSLVISPNSHVSHSFTAAAVVIQWCWLHITLHPILNEALRSKGLAPGSGLEPEQVKITVSSCISQCGCSSCFNTDTGLTTTPVRKHQP